MAEFTIKAYDPNTDETVHYKGTAENVEIVQEENPKHLEVSSDKLIDAVKILQELESNTSIALDGVELEELSSKRYNFTVKYNDRAGGGTQRVLSCGWKARGGTANGAPVTVIEFFDEFGEVEDMFYSEYVVAIIKEV